VPSPQRLVNLMQSSAPTYASLAYSGAIRRELLLVRLLAYQGAGNILSYWLQAQGITNGRWRSCGHRAADDLQAEKSQAKRGAMQRDGLSRGALGKPLDRPSEVQSSSLGWYRYVHYIASPGVSMATGCDTRSVHGG
jgi:hypothetical protein